MVSDVSEQFVATSLNEVPLHVVDGRGVRLLRRELGIRAFGINLFLAGAGKTVINEHNELLDVTRGHEEIYLVLSGSATFTIEGKEVVAHRGTVIVVHDPAASRAAMANEDGTEVLAIGGPCGCRKLGSVRYSGGSSLVAVESLLREFERDLIFAVFGVQAAA